MNRDFCQGRRYCLRVLPGVATAQVNCSGQMMRPVFFDDTKSVATATAVAQGRGAAHVHVLSVLDSPRKERTLQHVIVIVRVVSFSR